MTPEQAMKALGKHVPVNRARAHLKELENDGFQVSVAKQLILKLRASIREAITGKPGDIVSASYEPDPLIKIRKDMGYTGVKICSLMAQLGFPGKRTIEEMRVKLTEYLKGRDSIILHSRGSSIYDGNTRFVLAKILGVPDAEIQVRMKGDDVGMPLSEYRKLFSQ